MTRRLPSASPYLKPKGNHHAQGTAVAGRHGYGSAPEHVRGHYCQNRTARDYGRIADCIHDWMPTDADWTPALDIPIAERLHWVCRACEGKRWWRTEHDRGGTGYTLHDHYRITAQREQPSYDA